MIPMNFLKEGQKASYIQTGAWSEKAFKEAALFGTPVLAASSKENNYKNHLKIILSLHQCNQSLFGREEESLS